MKTLLPLLIVTLINFGCASKRATPDPTPPPVPEPTAPQAKAEEGVVPPPVESPKVSADSIRVTLVLGGAGVASFATIGIIKRFQEEGIVIDRIVTTGWPSLFALGYGFSKSVHDLEWFAMRLTEKDFYKTGIFSAGDGFASQEALSKTVENAFKQRDFSQSKVPVIISAANTEGEAADIYESGEWRGPLLKTMSVPGIFRPYPQEKDKEWINSLQGIDVSAAVEKDSKNIVAINMYPDYLNFIRNTKKDSSDGVFRKLYLAQMRKSIDHELKQAEIKAEIRTGSGPTDFGSKRLAIFAGYKEGARLAKLIRSTFR